VGEGEVCGNTNNPCIIPAARQYAKVFRIVGYQYTLLAYGKLVHIRVGKTALFQIIFNVFDLHMGVVTAPVYKGV
jgi:hypothetical protein